MAAESPISYALEDYDYRLPPALVAQSPAAERDGSRLLVLDRGEHRIEHRQFRDVVGYLRPGDLLVVNDTRVVPARLRGRKDSGGQAELLVLDPYQDDEAAAVQGYQCLIRTAKRAKPGSIIHLAGDRHAEILTPVHEGMARVRFVAREPLLEMLEAIGEVPLPPYLERNGGPLPATDAIDYQTVYAGVPGAVAAPTAGLHFTGQLLDELRRNGVEVASITLHVGYGTFAPLRVGDVRQHRMHEEFASIGAASAEPIERARREGRRIVAVGTTVVRVLEWSMARFGAVVPVAGLCSHYIYPGYSFRVVQAMVTNFHLPKSTLLLLVAAFAGRESILAAYRDAVRRGYRFYSYGDAMLIV